MKKIIICLVIFIGIIIVAASLISYISSSRANKVAIRVGYNIDSINNAPLMIAYEKNLFDKYGLLINLIPVGSSKENQQALAMGKIDIGFAGPANFFIPISKDAPIKIIAPSTTQSVYVFVRPDGQIETLNDLTGKTIASRRGEGTSLVLQYVLRKENVDVNSITFLDIEETNRPVALMEKKIIDATVGPEGRKLIYEKVGAVILKEWKTKGYIDETYPGTVIAVNTDFMTKNPQKIEKFMDAFIESQRFIKSSPGEAAQLVSQHINLGTAGVANFSPDEIQETWKGSVRYALWGDPNVTVEFAKISKETGDIDKTLTLEQIFDLRFEEKLKAAQIEIYGK